MHKALHVWMETKRSKLNRTLPAAGVINVAPVCVSAAAAGGAAHSTDGEHEPSREQSLWPPGAPAVSPRPGQPSNAYGRTKWPAGAARTTAGPQLSQRSSAGPKPFSGTTKHLEYAVTPSE